jgi:hypothetical protein
LSAASRKLSLCAFPGGELAVVGDCPRLGQRPRRARERPGFGRRQGVEGECESDLAIVGAHDAVTAKVLIVRQRLLEVASGRKPYAEFIRRHIDG